MSRAMRVVQAYDLDTAPLAGRPDMTRDTNDADTSVADAPDDAKGVPDPRDTDHPVGDDQAKRNQENEPVA